MKISKHVLSDSLSDGLSSLRMSDQERLSIRSALVEHMNVSEKKSFGPFFGFFLRGVAYSFSFLFVFFVGGLSYAAVQNSEPGGLLHKFEVDVIEEVQALFVPEETKVDWHLARVEERLDEARSSFVVSEDSFADPGEQALAMEAVIEDIQEDLVLALDFSIPDEDSTKVALLHEDFSLPIEESLEHFEEVYPLTIGELELDFDALIAEELL